MTIGFLIIFEKYYKSKLKNEKNLFINDNNL